MSKHPEEYLRHILDEINYLLDACTDIGEEEFMADETLQRAFARSIEIIGEAAKNLPKDFVEKHSNVDWKSIAGMRDKLIHEYFGVDYEIVWDVATNEVSKLKSQIEEILEGK